jgi:NAD(P)-dependent dehydrogenase (short-subunit alcohol dehydrogenase family)
MPCDVADDASVNAARDAVARDFDGVDVLLNNAGIQGVYGTPLDDLDWQELRDVFEVNTIGPAPRDAERLSRCCSAASSRRLCSSAR